MQPYNLGYIELSRLSKEYEIMIGKKCVDMVNQYTITHKESNPFGILGSPTTKYIDI